MTGWTSGGQSVGCRRWIMSLWPLSSTSVLLWTLLGAASCQHPTQEVEIFNSDKQTRLGWKSGPRNEWTEISLTMGTQSPGPVLQACGKRIKRNLLSPWMERGEALHLLMDVALAQEEEEASAQLGPLQVYLYDSDTAIAGFQDSETVLDLQTSTPFPGANPPSRISGYLSRHVALELGVLRRRGFQLAFSYSGRCVLLTSIRLYYRRCPSITSALVSFRGAVAGSEPLAGSCVEGAVAVLPPPRQCGVNGVWGPQQGGCTCGPGHQDGDNSCQACRAGHYRAANESAGCQACPPNTGTHREGSERCDCLQGFSRLPSDPRHLGCTKPPSSPVNVTARHNDDSTLTVTWDPPHDLGGRLEVFYRISCEREADGGRGWEGCGEDVVFLPDSAGRTNTSVSVTGLDPGGDYRLSVHAWNHVSSLQGAPHSSTATVTIHRWKFIPAVIPVTLGLQVSGPDPRPPSPPSRSLLWLTVGGLLGSLLLITIVPIVLCFRRQSCTKPRPEQHIQLLPMSTGISYRRPQTVEDEPQRPNNDSMVELLDGLSGGLLHNLKEVLVERNQLTLGKELGKGEFGSVYEGVFSPEEGVDMKVAVKTMKVGIHNQEDLHEFLREAEIMKNFHHENVVGLLGVTLQREEDSALPVPMVLLPYMKHGDLRRFLIATRYGDIPMFVPHQSLLRFMIDIATGMDYLSSQGCLHRDLAARNCMLGDDFRVCVADFGLSKKIHSSNYYRQRVAVRVPVKWMSMESLSESIYTTKSDVWSFGVTMWEIVSWGRTPYPGVHNHELLELLQSGHRLKPPEDCSPALYEVMRKCWDGAPACRPSFSELAEALTALLMELPVLEASLEASYINQGLQVAAITSQAPHTDSEARLENVYLPSPVGASAAARDEDEDEDEDVESGYLMSIAGGE